MNDTINSIDRFTAENFLYMEARLADQNQYERWAALWTDDAIYWIPANLDDYDPKTHLSIIYDDRERLQDRVDRLVTGRAWAQDPRSRLRRVISNVELGPTIENGDVEIYSNVIIGELRNGLHTIYFANQTHRLRLTPEGIRLAYKKVMLINNDEPIHNLSFLV